MKVKAKVNRKGKLSLEFIGFTGDDCVAEREKLKAQMLSLGVPLVPDKVVEKTRQQTIDEAKNARASRAESSDKAEFVRHGE